MAWMAATLSATSYLDAGPTRMLPPALQAVTTIVGLWRPMPYAGSLFAVLGTLLYLASGIVARFGVSGVASRADVPLTSLLLSAAPGIATVFLALQGTGWLADLLATRTERDEAQRQNDRQLIEDLVPTHGETGLLKWTFALRPARDEILRARRYNSQLSLALLGPRESLGEGDDAAALDEMAIRQAPLAALLKEHLRPTDVVALYRTGDIAVLMPQTGLQGALIALDKVRSEASKRDIEAPAVGLAEFPDDGADIEELASEAEHALQFARESELGIVSRNLLL